MHAHRNVFYLLLVAGMLSFSCRSNTHKSKEPSEEFNQVDNAGLKQGPWKIYEDSVLISKGSYVDNLPDGLWTSWHLNGQMKEEGYYKNGMKEGMWIEWYPDGEIMWKGEWDNGTRKIGHLENQAKVSILGVNLRDHVLAVDSLYQLHIRIQNIPAENLFVEVSAGEIAREGNSDLFSLKTPSDSMLTMAIGYIPDLEFKDFRNLISEIEFKLR